MSTRGRSRFSTVHLSARSLAGQFLVFQLLVVLVVLGAVAAVSVTQSTQEFREVRGQRMIAVAENLASTPIVRDRYADPFATQVLAAGRMSSSVCSRGPLKNNIPVGTRYDALHWQSSYNGVRINARSAQYSNPRSLRLVLMRPRSRSC